MNFRLYMAQRLSAMIMAPLVLLHLGVMIYAVQNGLDSAEILNRTRGSVFWGFSYGLFVLAVAVHAAIGLRVIAYEWFGRSGTQLNVITTAVAAVLLAMGWRAVYAVVIA
ncbi:MAG: succinate dehydrogenase [Proteobacteria bacterium]|nr:succinate dehydrogenase [Pseudomonadota bacterium]